MTPRYTQIARQQLSRIPCKLGILFLAVLAWSGVASSQQWIAIISTPQFNVDTGVLLTDGGIMVHQYNSSAWWKLTPDKNTGFYRNGKWTQLKSFPSSWGYAPLYFASAVLKDGHVIVEGGEYNGLVQDWTPLGAIYDPVANTWTKVPAPSGWTQVGDAQSVVLPDGTFMLANINNGQSALLDEATLTWTIVSGAGKHDANDEEGWTLLPDGNVLTVDTYLGVGYGGNGKNSEIFDTSTETWSSAGSTGVQLWDSRYSCGKSGETNEVGPAVLRYDGTVFATGANTCSGKAGHTSIYNPTTGLWTAGPNIPGKNDMADAPASILPDGNVLVDTNPGYGKSPSTLYEFNGTKFISIPQPVGLTGNTEGGRMLATPDGTIFFAHVGSPQVWFYLPAGTYNPAWAPTITTCPASITVGQTYTISGTQFNGLSQGAAFGDDAQSATNYPIVRIQNNATLHYFFARTHGHSTMGVATGALPTSTSYDVLTGTETGLSTLQVIANGIPSAPCENVNVLQGQ